MSGLPGFRRRGFRDWSEVLADLRAVEVAPPPLNEARVWYWDPGVGAAAPVGALAAQLRDDELVISVDGATVVSMERSTFRGGWLRIWKGHFYLNVDTGQRWQIQVSGPGGLP